jgi:hypothetical protein
MKTYWAVTTVGDVIAVDAGDMDEAQQIADRSAVARLHCIETIFEDGDEAYKCAYELYKISH